MRSRALGFFGLAAAVIGVPGSLLSTAAGFSAASPQEPTRVVESSVFRRTPSTWQDAVAGAEVITHVRIVDRAYETKPGHRGTEFVVTRYEAEILELLKGDARPRRSTLEIVRHGGVTREGDEIVRYLDPKFPDYEIGAEYVLFLQWDFTNDAYAPYGGLPLTYRLDGDAQRVVSAAGRFAAEDGDTPLTFLAFIRASLSR